MLYIYKYPIFHSLLIITQWHDLRGVESRSRTRRVERRNFLKLKLHLIIYANCLTNINKACATVTHDDGGGRTINMKFTFAQ